MYKTAKCCQMVDIKCENCGREILVLKEYLREKMFCTIGCMDSYQDANKIGVMRQ